MAFIEFNEGAGGGLPGPFIILDHYSPLDLCGFVDAQDAPSPVHWADLYRHLARERVTSFDPQHHDLPIGCANTMATVFDGNGRLQHSLVYSFGDTISADTARTIAQVHTPETSEDRLLKTFPDLGHYFLTATNGVGILYVFTLALYDVSLAARPLRWENRGLRSSLPRP